MRSFSHFDRWMILLLVTLAAGLGGAAWLSNQLGLRSPSLASQEISVLGPVGLVFDQKMQTASVDSRWQNNQKIVGRLTWDGQTMWFWPGTALVPGAEYSFQLVGGAQAADGQVIRQAANWSVRVRKPEVVFLSPATNGSELWETTLEGVDLHKLTQTGNQVYDFAISYDGEWIAYSVKNSGLGKDLWIVKRDGSSRRQVADCGGDTCIQPAWSPDGKWLAYSRKRVSVVQGEKFSPGPRIWTLEITSGKTAALFQETSIGGTNPVWSPDGSHLAFFDPPAKVIHVLDTQTGKELMLQSQLGVVGAWSPDGTRLWYGDLVSSDSLPFGSAFVADIATEQIQQLFTSLADPEDFSPPEPSPDGNWVVIGARFPGGSRSIQLQLMHPDGTDQKFLTNDNTFTHGAYSWDPTGKFVLYQRILLNSSQSRPEVWVWNQGADKAARIAQDAALPAWLP